MKTPATTGRRLSHYTVNTGDRQSFRIDANNYHPIAVELAGTMTKQALWGYRVLTHGGDNIVTTFALIRDKDERPVSVNRAWVDPSAPEVVQLETWWLASERYFDTGGGVDRLRCGTVRRSRTAEDLSTGSVSRELFLESRSNR